MIPTPVRMPAALEAARRQLEAHARSLRRKRDRRLARGEATDDLAARLASEEDLIRRMRRREA
jgi:hypothetical protein